MILPFITWYIIIQILVTGYIIILAQLTMATLRPEYSSQGYTQNYGKYNFTY